MNRGQSLKLVDGPVTFAGAVSLEVRPEGVHPWRIQHRDLPLYEPALVARAASPSGVRLTLVSDTPWITLKVQPPPQDAPAHWTFDLLVDGVLHQRITQLRDQGVFEFTNLPAGEHRLELYLFQNETVIVQELTIAQGATARRWDDPRPTWVVYGSSITQAGAAAGPSEVWPAIVANTLGLNLTSLGYGGNCHLEPVVAQMIRDLPTPDYISLCLGINVQGGSTLSKRTFRAAVLGLLLTIREKHTRTPMVVVSPICSPPREDKPNLHDITLPWMRDTIRSVVDLLQQRGDEHLFYCDGLELFGPEFTQHMPDLLHPDAQGYRLLAQQYMRVVMPRLSLAAPVPSAHQSH